MTCDNHCTVIQYLSVVDPNQHQTFFDTFNPILLRIDAHFARIPVIQVLSKVKPEHYQAFATACDLLHNRAENLKIINAIFSVEPDSYQKFTDLCQFLLTNIEYPISRSNVIELVSKVSPEHYQALATAYEQLSDGMNQLDRTALVRVLVGIDASLYTNRDFINTCIKFYDGINFSDHPCVIEAVAGVDQGKYEAFTDTYLQLSEGMESAGRKLLIEILSKIDSNCCTTALATTCKQIIFDLNLHSSGSSSAYVWVVEDLAKVDAALHTPGFANLCSQFLNVITGKKDSDLINSLAKVKPTHYQDFTLICNKLIRSVHGSTRIHIIKSFTSVDPSNYQAINHNYDQNISHMTSADIQLFVRDILSDFIRRKHN